VWTEPDKEREGGGGPTNRGRKGQPGNAAGDQAGVEGSTRKEAAGGRAPGPWCGGNNELGRKKGGEPGKTVSRTGGLRGLWTGGGAQRGLSWECKGWSGKGGQKVTMKGGPPGAGGGCNWHRPKCLLLQMGGGSSGRKGVVSRC